MLCQRAKAPIPDAQAEYDCWVSRVWPLKQKSHQLLNSMLELSVFAAIVYEHVARLTFGAAPLPVAGVVAADAAIAGAAAGAHAGIEGIGGTGITAKPCAGRGCNG